MLLSASAAEGESLSMRLLEHFTFEHWLCLVQRFIPAAMEELGRVDVINQDAKWGREAEFKLGNQEEIKAKVGACLIVLYQH